jgi:hypothetical protein
MNKIKAFLIKLHQWALSHPILVRLLHTFWMAAVSYVALHPIHTSNDVKVVLIGAGAAGLSGVKNYSWPLIVSWATQSQTHITPPTDFTPPRS